MRERSSPRLTLYRGFSPPRPTRQLCTASTYRIDHDASRTHSWFVTIQRRKRIYRRHFSDSVHGGKRQSLEAAKAYRAQLIAQLRPITRREVCSIRKKNNHSGVPGLHRVDAIEMQRGRPIRRVYWDAQWPGPHGRGVHRKFSILKYGERGAYRRALKARRNALATLKKFPFRNNFR